MSITKVPYGKPVKLLIDFQGFPDGRLVQFEIWKRKDGKEEKVSEVYGVTKRGKGIGWWIPRLEERKATLPLEKQITGKVGVEKYYFLGKIDDKEVKSDDFQFTHGLEIYLENEEGKAIDRVKYRITFSDGSKKKGVVINGRARIAEALSGKFKLELKGHEFVFS